MRAIMSLVSIIVVLAIGYWIYASSLKPGSPSGTPNQVVSTVGVKMDLLSLAQAERIYQTSHGSYASLGQLYSSGTLIARKSASTGYTYSSDVSSDGFTITARCESQPAAPCPSFSVDQTMQVQQLP